MRRGARVGRVVNQAHRDEDYWATLTLAEIAGAFLGAVALLGAIAVLTIAGLIFGTAVS